MALDWTSQRIKTLTKLWDEGLTTSEIGRKLGVTKNSVVGKAHRMGLPKRQSPIAKRQAQSKPKAGIKTEKPATKSEAKPAAKPKAPAAHESPKETEEPSVIKLENLQSGMCSWPFNEPGTPEFYFCGKKPTVPDKPYCLEHCMMAYVKSSKDKDKKKQMRAQSAAARPTPASK